MPQQQSNTRVVNGINTRVLHGKDYVEVCERTRILHELRKAGEIKEFEMIESGPREIAGQVYWQVSARINGSLYIGSAEVKFDAPKNTPDGTNPICCAETSAFGRMLAFAGLGTVQSIASYDEIMRSQPFVAVVTPAQTNVVEEGNTPRRLERPKVSSAIKERLNSLYKRAKDLRLFEAVAGDEEASVKAFFKLVGEIIDIKITDINDLNTPRLDVLEQYINSKDAA